MVMGVQNPLVKPLALQTAKHFAEVPGQSMTCPTGGAANVVVNMARVRAIIETVDILNSILSILGR